MNNINSKFKIQNLKFIVTVIILTIVGGLIFFGKNSLLNLLSQKKITTEDNNLGGLTENFHPLSIEYMRKQLYPGSDVVIEQTLEPGVNYKQFIASYKSEGLKIYALLTVPDEEIPKEGFPVVIFNHGYIPPEQYQTTEKYVAYVAGFAKNDYIVFKPDYRGHGNSEGKPEGAYYSPAYTTDVLNALSSIKRYPGVNPLKIGMWGHSLGGNITLRSLVVSSDIKAAVIWGGVVGSYQDMMNNWRHSTSWRPSQREESVMRPNRQRFIDTYGLPEQNPQFWDSISPLNYLSDISGPVQIHHGLADDEVPWEFSQSLSQELEKQGKTYEYYTYPGGDHNLSGADFNTAMQRSVEFFDKYLK